MLRSSRQLARIAPRKVAAPSAIPSTCFSTRSPSSALHTPRRPASALQARLIPLSLQARYTNSPYDKIDKKAEAEIAKKKLESNPEAVSTESSRIHLFEPEPAKTQKEEDLTGGLKKELVSLHQPVPPQIPYGTPIDTLPIEHCQGYLQSQRSAKGALLARSCRHSALPCNVPEHSLSELGPEPRMALYVDICKPYLHEP